MSTLFDADYFENGPSTGKSLYENYRWMPELTLPFAAAIAKHIGMEYGDTVLDFGCAKGFLVKALRLLHYDAYGADISEYAVKGRENLQLIEHAADISLPPHVSRFDFIIAKDTLEHIPQVKQELQALMHKARCLFVVVPLGDGEKYVAADYEKDTTHIIRQPLEWWVNTMENSGWCVREAVYDLPYIKDRWRHIPGGNGFITAYSWRYK